MCADASNNQHYIGCRILGCLYLYLLCVNNHPKEEEKKGPQSQSSFKLFSSCNMFVHYSSNISDRVLQHSALLRGRRFCFELHMDISHWACALFRKLWTTSLTYADIVLLNFLDSACDRKVSSFGMLLWNWWLCVGQLYFVN